MVFKRLFQVLVLGGVVVASSAGCSTRAEAQTKKSMKDGGTMADAGMKAK
jgi:hypothetical protein